MFKMFRKPNVKKMQAECDAFNASNPVGSRVMVQLDGREEPFDTVTTSKAQILSGHSPVIWLEKVSGCYLLDRVTPVTPVAPVNRVRAGNAAPFGNATEPDSSPVHYPTTDTGWTPSHEPAHSPAPAYSSGGGGDFGGGGASGSWGDSSTATDSSGSSDSGSSGSSSSD